MKINRCDCCGKETKNFVVIRFGDDGLFFTANTSEVCCKCRDELYKQSREFLTKFNSAVKSEERPAEEDAEGQK